MMTYRAFFLFSLFFFPFLLAAQTPPNNIFEAATIYYPNGETADGYIARTDFKRLGEEVFFTKELNTTPTKYYTSDIDGFKFKGDNLEFQKIDFQLITTDDDYNKVKVKHTRFSKKLVESAINIHKVELKRGDYDSEVTGSVDYLYVVNKGKDTLQLDLLESKKQGSALVVKDKYKGILKYLTSDCASINTASVAFSDKSIINLIQKYNACIGNEDVAILASTSRKIITEHRLGIFGAVADYKFEDHSYYGLGYSVSLFSPEVSRSLGATIGFGFTHQKYLAKIVPLELTQSHVKIDMLVDCRIIQLENQKLTLQTGLSWYPHLSTKPGNLSSSDLYIFSYALLPINVAYDYNNFRCYVGISRTVDIGFAYRFQ